MADKGPPDITSKLSAPKKISGFEKQRQEAEAKRLREEAENRAALREFEDSFADDDEDDFVAQVAAGRSAFGPPRSGESAGYVRGAPMRNSGPGTLGPAPGALPPSLKRKREAHNDRDRDSRKMDDAIKRPTMQLSSLPRNTTEATVRAFMPPSLKVDEIAFVPSSTSRTRTALVALAPDTPSSDIDSAISTLQNKYLGFGSYLNISKHINISSDLSSAFHTIAPTQEVHPFGAKPMVREHPPSHSFRNAPPPDSLPPAMRHQGPPHLVVNVTPPSDLKQLTIINKTVEKLIMYGPEWECLLMAQPEVQHGPEWAFLYDNTSQAHVWYRWLVWQYYASRPPSKDNLPAHEWTIMDELARSYGQVRIFDEGPFFAPPSDRPKFEHVQNLTDLVNDPGYVSSDLDTDDEDDHIIQNQGGALEDTSVPRPRYLNPYRKAKLTFFLHHLPDTTTYLCLGDVHAVTDLVIKFAGQGAEEVVDMLMSNLENPFHFSVNYNYDRVDGQGEDEERKDGDGGYDPETDGPRASFGMLAHAEEPDTDMDTETREAMETKNEVPAGKDISGAQLVGLYVISDALAATSVSGVRDAWKYRALFESALTSRRTFEKLGRMPKQYKWGRVRAEQWKSRICVVLDCWEKEQIFAPESHKRFKDVFLNPPLTEEEQKVKDEQDKQEQEEEMKSRWKTGDNTTATPEQLSKEPTPQPPQPQAQVPSTTKRQPSRPSAADLIAATAQGEAPPPKPAPTLSNFSMSLNAPATASSSEEPKKPAMSFSLGGSAAAPKSKFSMSVGAKPAAEPVKEKRESLDVFGDSDSE